MQHADIAIIGAGMAGASLAAELAGHASVIVLEAESQPGYHSTGRSAAFWSETYGGPHIQPLTRASGAFLKNPPHAFAEETFLKARGALTIARAADRSLLEEERRAFSGAGVSLRLLDRTEIEQRVPGLLPDWEAGLLEDGCSDIDVAALHAAYLRAARRGGVTMMTNARVQSIAREGALWRVGTASGAVSTKILANAAGAWADDIARLAGASSLGVQPYRRTVVQLRTDPCAPAALPLVLDAREGFYFKPEAGGRLWLSPQDETPLEPCDVRPEELDIALAIDRLQQVVDWRVEHVEHSWAGLRSFAPDRLPVYGFDPKVPDFFWFAGQGGFGIQTAPAAAKIGAALLKGMTPEPMVSSIDLELYSPGRFAN